MAVSTINFRVDDSERDELVARAAREKVNLSDYIRVRLGLRGHGLDGGEDVQIDPQHDVALQEQIADHELRLRALEAADTSRRARA